MEAIQTHSTSQEC